MSADTAADRVARAPVPAGWHAPTQALWADGHVSAALESLVHHVNGLLAAGQPAPADLYAQLGYYLFLQQQLPPALDAFQRAHQLAPDDPAHLLNLSVLHHRLRQDEQAVGFARRALALRPDDFVALDTLCAALHRLQRWDEARQAGSTALTLKDDLVHRHRQAPAGWHLPAARASAGQRQMDGKSNVIAFSLWGAQPRYLRGALQNLLVAPQVFPGWTLRFYADASVPAPFRQLLGELGAELVLRPGSGYSTRERLCWRFEVANDPAVGYFLVRDADAVISTREAMAVDAWLAGDAHFHVIRDHWTHTDLMLAGLWGGVAGVLPALAPMVRRYRSTAMETPNVDQWFLRDCVWPMVRGSVCAHDRLFSPPGAQPLPAPEPSGQPTPHIGGNEHAMRPAQQARALGGWLRQYSWL